MAITLPDNVRGPILDLTLPASGERLDVILRNATIGQQLRLKLGAIWDGDDLSLDFRRRTITDQTGADRSALLDPSDMGLWVPEPLVQGSNDVEIEVWQGDLSIQTKSPQTLANDAAVGTVAWSNPGNAATSNDVRATAGLSATVSNYLKATNFGFALPAGAVIFGVDTSVECSSVSNAVEDNAVRLVKGGVIQATNRAKHPWLAAEMVRNHGGASDLWGTTLSKADVEAANFGYVVSAKGVGGADTARIDHMQLSLLYRAPVALGATATLRWEKGYH